MPISWRLVAAAGVCVLAVHLVLHIGAIVLLPSLLVVAPPGFLQGAAAVLGVVAVFAVFMLFARNLAALNASVPTAVVHLWLACLPAALVQLLLVWAGVSLGTAAGAAVVPVDTAAEAALTGVAWDLLVSAGAALLAVLITRLPSRREVAR